MLCEARLMLAMFNTCRNDIGYMLVQCSSVGNTHHLDPAADGESWHVSGFRGAHQRDLEAVPVLVDPACFLVSVLAEAVRLDVPTAADDQPVDSVEHLLGSVSNPRQDDRNATGLVDGLHVGV